MMALMYIEKYADNVPPSERSPSVLEESYTNGSSLLVHTVLDMMVPLYPHPEVSIAAGQ